MGQNNYKMVHSGLKWVKRVYPSKPQNKWLFRTINTAYGMDGKPDEVI
jgi:hypothetical protein